MKKNQKLSPKQAVIKGLETRHKNLLKKLSVLQGKYREDQKEIMQDIQVVLIQLRALKK